MLFRQKPSKYRVRTASGRGPRRSISEWGAGSDRVPTATEGAPGITFNGIKQTDFLAEIEAAAADDAAIADLESELKMKRDVRDDKYVAAGEKRSKVGQGVAGSPDYGDDSPLFGARGFVGKSERFVTGTPNKSRDVRAEYRLSFAVVI